MIVRIIPRLDIKGPNLRGALLAAMIAAQRFPEPAA
jgi:hypothetical protein